MVLLFILAACVDAAEEAAVQYAQAYQRTYAATEVADNIQEITTPVEEYDIEEYEQPAEEPLTSQSDMSTLIGIFFLEDEEDLMTLEFSNDTFVINMSYASLELGFDIPGYIAIGGTFAVDEIANIVSLNVDTDYVITLMREIIDVVVDHIIQNDPAMQDESEDSETLQVFMTLILMAVEEMLDELVNEFIEDFEDFNLRFYDTFDRLYSDDGVFVRR